MPDSPKRVPAGNSGEPRGVDSLAVQQIRALERQLRHLLLDGAVIPDLAVVARQWRERLLLQVPDLRAEVTAAADAVTAVDQSSGDALSRTLGPAMRRLAHLRSLAMGETSLDVVQAARIPPETPSPYIRKPAKETVGRPNAARATTAEPKSRRPAVVDFTLDSPIDSMPRYDKRYATALKKLDIVTVGDLLHYYPRRYDDYSHLLPISQLTAGVEVTIEAEVVQSKVIGAYGRRGRRVEVVLGDATGTIKAVWFNQEWIAKQLTPGLRMYVSGKVESFGGRLQFTAPTHERISATEAVHTGRLVPVYPLISGLSQTWLRARMKWAVDTLAHTVSDPYPAALRERWRLLPLHEALQQVHFPDSDEERDASRRRLAFDDLFFFQLSLLRFKRDWQQQGRAAPLVVEEDRLQEFIGRLPFALTAGQAEALRQIVADIGGTRPMGRLLQGDVGSGKTAVAALAMLVAVEHGYQAALMAPTEILAEQHARTLATFFEVVDPMLQPVLITGSMGDAARRRAWERMASGQAKIAVGTHALIQEAGSFSRLALVVVDEQHRFGVMQRAALRRKGDAPHLLAMTATPIPRTLALTVHGDLDLSVIREMPVGRLPIKTRFVPSARREGAYSFVRKEVQNGRQAFVICPLVEESDVINAKSAVAEYEHLRTEVFPDLRLELVHGRMKSAEKDAAMQRFRERQADILVATTVVEVGVDVPNATVMVIEGAERFGLAQLHQLRGRVGRGQHQSYCILLASDELSQDGEQRLRAVESTTDGFVLAEQDLRLRGPGAFFGVEQSGIQPLFNLATPETLELAREAALDLLSSDPELAAAEHQGIAQRAREFWEGMREQLELH